MCVARAGLPIVPVVPWEGTPAARGPRSSANFFTTLCWRSLTTKKGRQLFGRRKVHPGREIPGYSYEKSLMLVWGPRMVNPALCVALVVRTYALADVC